MVTPTAGARPGSGSLAPVIDRMIVRGAARPNWMAITAILLVLAVVWSVTYLAGGSRTALPHLFYIPIIASTIRFRFRAVIPAGLLAGAVAGPLLPHDTQTGAPQDVNDWVVRTVMFLLVGATFALAMQVRERVADHELAHEVRAAVFAESDAYASAADADPEVLAVLDKVIADRAFHIVYQPVYALSDGRLVAVEALTRFDVEPARSPDVWFRAAATVGRGTDLEIAAIELAVAGSSELPLNVLLAVNVSPATLADPRLRAILTSNPGRMFGIEITEHAVVDDYRLLVDAVAELRGLGVDVAVDDAGAGFASLRHIVHLAPDTIKVDLSLTQGISGSALKRALAAALVEFAGATQAFIVAEGVEEVEDLTAWATLGATAVQGYLTGRPGSIDAPAVSPVVLAVRNGARLPSQTTTETAARTEAPAQ